MSEAVIHVHFSEPLLRGVEQEAERSGMSVDQWLRRLAENQVKEAYVTAKYFSRTPQPGDAAELIAILDSGRDNPPMPGDEWEE